MANNKFFTNTYITGGGRQNYLRADYLEDPLFTSFTFDIDFITSPLFYTIKDYTYPKDVSLAEKIEIALVEMYGRYMGVDQGYDILPVLSADILNGIKLGFGLQQNVYMDLPLYGATEYIYMVDKRNGLANQNDVRYTSGGGANSSNSYKLGESVKSIVNDSDMEWAQRMQQQCEEQIAMCNSILSDTDDGGSDSDSDSDGEISPAQEHRQNKQNLDYAQEEYNNKKQRAKNDEAGEGSDTEEYVEYSEDELVEKVNKYKTLLDEYERLKKDITNYVNESLANYQNEVTSLYMSNECIKKIFSYTATEIEGKKDEYKKTFESMFPNFVESQLKPFLKNIINIYKSTISYSKKVEGMPNVTVEDNNVDTFLYDLTPSNNKSEVRDIKIINKFRDKLEKFALIVSKSGENDSAASEELVADILVVYSKTPPEWSQKVESHFKYFIADDKDVSVKEVNTMLANIMKMECDASVFVLDGKNGEYPSETIKGFKDYLTEYEKELNNLRAELYGMRDGEVCDKHNATSDSLYGKYKSAENTYNNDDYSQAQKTLSVVTSSGNSINQMIDAYNGVDDGDSDDYNEPASADAQQSGLSTNVEINAPQTVLDMLGFISGMRRMVVDYPYVIQGISGLDTAYNKHYGIKDPYLGSGDDKITLTCLESLDLRVSSMFNRYFNAVYDRQYRRERVPVNLRRFNCSVYVHDVRNFVRNSRDQYVNKIVELSDMYHSVIEFRFYDCEIVPEETGNIFNDVSNEAPSEMKKTNFTFTYGNCVVNFVPQST